MSNQAYVSSHLISSLRTCRICVIAGDISPIDVITHLPVLCEENDIPYIYVPSKEVHQPSGAPNLRNCFVLFLACSWRGPSNFRSTSGAPSLCCWTFSYPSL